MNTDDRIKRYYALGADGDEPERTALWDEMNQIERTAANRLLIMDDYRKGLAALDAAGAYGFFSRNALQKALDAEDEFYSTLIAALERGVTKLLDI